MFCNRCGNDNPANSTFCNQCGQPLGGALEAPAVPTAAVPAADAKTDNKAVISLVLGILSLTIFSILAGLPAVILGHISRSNIQKSMGRLKGEGIALAGLIMGYLSLMTIPMILIIAAIAIPNLLRARMAANEASAVGSIRTINVASITYSATYGKGFPADLKMLGGPEGQKPSAEAAGLIDSVLASGQKSGYTFRYQAVDSDGDGVMDKYFVIAEPVTQGSSGQRSFCSDETGIIRFETSSSCTPASIELQ